MLGRTVPYSSEVAMTDIKEAVRAYQIGARLHILRSHTLM